MTQAMMISHADVQDLGMGGLIVGVGLLLIVVLLLWVLAGKTEESEP